jgi:hypothetical protein
LIFFRAFPPLSGKFGKESLRFRVGKTFFFVITIFLYQNKNPVAHLSHWRQFCASLKWGVLTSSLNNKSASERSTHGRRNLQGFLPQLDEFYFTTVKRKFEVVLFRIS